MPESKRPLKVFLCHAHDDKSKARELYRYLKRRGIQPWLDEEDLLAGQDWRVEIPKAIKASDAIIICLSKNSINKEGYVQAEITFALEKALEIPPGRIFIIPVKFEECGVPDNLQRYHWVDLFDEGGYERLMKSLKLRASQLERTTVQISKQEDSSYALNSGKGPEQLPAENSNTVQSFKQIVDVFFSRRVLVCGFLGVFVCGFIWNILNSLLGWPYYLGGAGNEPHSFSAFIWGSIVVFPVAFFAYLALYKKYILANSKSLWKVSIVIILYTIFGAIGAVIFYDSGFRNYIAEQKFGYGSQELIIVSVWALVISLLASLPILILNRTFKEVLNARIVFLQIPFCVVISFLAVVISLFIHAPESQVAIIRGFLAGLGLRFGLFVGIVSSIFLKSDNIK